MIKRGLTVLVILIMVISCQEDSVSENTEALSSSSQLTNTLLSMSVVDTAIDNVIDSVDCFNIKLPVQVVANKRQVVITSETDYKDIKAIFDQSATDNDELLFVFPVTIIYSDYREVVVNNQQEYDALAGLCTDVPDYIGNKCISLVFPITIYGYNVSFQKQNAYVLNNNAELYAVLQNFGTNEYYSINYPVSLNVTDGAGVTVNNNNEFIEAVNKALQGCEHGGCANPGILINNLLLYIPFSNGTVQDLKGNSIAVSPDITFTSDRSGNQNCAIVFNGNQFLHIPKNNNNGIVQGDAFSVSLWFRMQNTNNDDLENLFTKGNTNEQGFSISVSDLNAPLFVAGTVNVWDTSWRTDAVLPVDTSNWHYLVVTISNDNTLKLYRDGQLRNSITSSAAQISDEILDYYIGNNFKGFMDDLRVYKKELSQEEVQTLFELEGDCNTCLE